MSEVQAAPQFYAPQETVFRFKKDKLGNKRANVTLQAKMLTRDGLIDIINRGDEKEIALVMDQVNLAFRDVLAEKVGDDESFDQAKYEGLNLSWAAIANMPKEDRRVSSIAKEVWDAFVADYMAIMPGLTKTSVEANTIACDIYVKKMAPARSNKPVLERLKMRLALYIENSQKAEEFQEILEVLLRRIEAYLKAETPELVADNL
jgi:hypothetical protein